MLIRHAMFLYRTKDARSRRVPLLGPGWYVLWPYDVTGTPPKPRARAAAEIPRALRKRILAGAVTFPPCACCMSVSAGLAYRAGTLFSGPAVLALSSIVAMLLIWPLQIGLDLRRTKPYVLKAALEARSCPACGYSLIGVAPGAHGCSTCPECAAAWRLP